MGGRVGSELGDGDGALDIAKEIMEEDRDALKELADSQHGDYIMTEAEAEALRDTSKRNLPKIPVRQLREKALDELTKQAQDLNMGYDEDCNGSGLVT